MSQNNLVSIIRAHEVQEKGFSEHFQSDSAPPLLVRPGGCGEEEAEGTEGISASQQPWGGTNTDLSTVCLGFPKASFPYESVSLEVEQQKEGSQSKIPFYSIEDNLKRLPLGEWWYDYVDAIMGALIVFSSIQL